MPSMLWYFPKIELWMWPPLVYPCEHMAVRDVLITLRCLPSSRKGRKDGDGETDGVNPVPKICPHAQRSGGSVPEPVLTVNLGIVEMSPLSSRAVVLELPVAATH